MFFSKIWPYDQVFDSTWSNFRPGLDLTEVNILTKFHEDRVKTRPFEVYTSFFLRFDLVT